MRKPLPGYVDVDVVGRRAAFGHVHRLQRLVARRRPGVGPASAGSPLRGWRRAATACRDAAGVLEDDRTGAGLDDAAVLHHRHAIAQVGDDPEVVRDDQHAHVRSLLQLAEQVEDLGLHGDVEGGRRLVGDDQVGVAGHRSGDEDALRHAAGDLVRVGAECPCGIGDADPGEQRQRLLLGLRLATCPRATRIGSTSWLPIVNDGSRLRHRLLRDVGDLAAAELVHLLLGPRAPGPSPSKRIGAAEQLARRAAAAEDRQRGLGLARAGLADEAEDLAAATVSETSLTTVLDGHRPGWRSRPPDRSTSQQHRLPRRPWTDRRSRCTVTATSPASTRSAAGLRRSLRRARYVPARRGRRWPNRTSESIVMPTARPATAAASGLAVDFGEAVDEHARPRSAS